MSTFAPGEPESARPGDIGRYLPRNSFGLKLLLVCALALMMAIPAAFVWGLVEMRSRDAQSAVYEVGALAGGPQSLLGPVVVVPYERDILQDNRVQTVVGQLVLSAETGTGTLRLDSEVRRRGLQDVPLYDLTARFEASFNPARLAEAAPPNARIRWADAGVHMGLTDLRGVESATLTVAGQPLELSPIDPGMAASPYGPPLGSLRVVGAKLPFLTAETQEPFAVTADLAVTGAARVGLAAFARETTLTLSGDWSSPSFDGGVLPDERTVSDDGFTAAWRVPYLARGAAGAGADVSLDALVSMGPGVSLLDPANPYQAVVRALKYAPMFLGLVFLTYFLFETVYGRRAHPAQYVLVGLAQLVFYLLLLSVSEIIGFNLGFLIAAVCTVLAISLYAGSVFGSRASALKALGVFSALYALIYVLMRMEDYALLVGSIASFAAIAATMWMTRNLDWYGAKTAGLRRDLQAS
jgi:inner membrane protein